MEMEYFVEPGTDEEWYRYWQTARLDWYQSLGMKPEHLRLRLCPHIYNTEDDLERAAAAVKEVLA